MFYYVSCFSNFDEYPRLEHYEVPKEVYVYIKQLETYIKNPEESQLKKIYKTRFNSK